MISLLALPGSVHAQEDLGTHELRVGALLGGGFPTSAGAGARIGVGLGSRVGLEAEYSRWLHLGGCQSDGRSACDGGALYLGGVSLGLPGSAPIQGSLHLNAGIHQMFGTRPISGLRPSLAVGVGARLSATDRLGLDLRGRLLEVFGDGEYKALVGKDLRYLMLTLGVDYGLPF